MAVIGHEKSFSLSIYLSIHLHIPLPSIYLLVLAMWTWNALQKLTQHTDSQQTMNHTAVEIDKITDEKCHEHWTKNNEHHIQSLLSKYSKRARDTQMNPFLYIFTRKQRHTHTNTQDLRMNLSEQSKYCSFPRPYFCDRYCVCYVWYRSVCVCGVGEQRKWN